MSIDDLKSLMDEFDPASLLPELENVLGRFETVIRIALLVGPVLLLVLGILYLTVPPKEANHHFGYRCYFGMGSVDAWRFTQRLAGIVWSGLGLILLIVMSLITGGFAGMEMMDMIWKGIRCALWEAGLVALACVAINVTAALCFDAKGEYRKKKD